MKKEEMHDEIKRMEMKTARQYHELDRKINSLYRVSYLTLVLAIAALSFLVGFFIKTSLP